MKERFFVFGRSGDIDLGCECDTLEQALSHLAQVVAHPSPYDGSRLKIDQFTVVRGEKVNVTKVELPKVGKPPKPDPDVIERHAETWAAVDPRQRWRIAKAVRLVDDVR
jgi:hypothetical protein